MIRKITLLFIVLFVFNSVEAQVTASFSANQTSGCPNPFLLILTSTSTSAPGAIDSWSWLVTFPDGVTTESANTNQFSNTFTIPGFYDVELTVCSGGVCDTEIINDFFEVFARPTIAMSISPLSGCPPHTVCFDGTFDPVCGTIASSVIDVRDGTIYSDVEDVCHPYTISGSYTNFLVSVTNSCGCSTTETFTDVVSISPAPIANFTANQTFSCNPPLNVNFTNTSSSTSGGTVYEWNIPGLVNGASTQNLTQSFGVGSYDVELIVTNPNGCSDTILRPNYIVVGNPDADFTSNVTTVCPGETVNFTDISTGSPSSWSWTFEGHGSSNGQNPGRVFNTPGTWDVILETSYPGGCTDQITLANYITVRPLPVNNFTVTDSGSCVSPFTTTYTNTSTNANTTTFTFPGGTPNTFTGSGSVNVTYNTFGSFNVSMTSTSAAGCTNTTNFSNVINISQLTVNIAADTIGGCIPLTTNLNYTLSPSETVASQSWYLPGSDIGSSSALNPSPVYNAVGCFDAGVTVTTVNGCVVSDTVPGLICAGTQPTGSFSVTPNTVCFEEEEVCATYLGLDADTIWWDFGDPAPPVFGGGSSTVCHPYSEELGDFTVTMVAYNNGCAGDTLAFVDTVHIVGPIAAFLREFDGCSTWNTFNFTDESLEADSVFYTFGDPTTNMDTSSSPDPQWTYPADDTLRTYTVTQFAYNFANGCEHEVSHDILVYPPHADFTYNNEIGCAPLNSQFFNASFFPGSNSASRYNWAGTLQFSGPGANTIWGSGTDRVVSFPEPGIFTISHENRDPRGCRDTITKTDIIIRHGIIGAYTQDVTEGCLPLTVTFEDTSYAPMSYIASRHWDFGVPTITDDTSNIADPVYIYNQAGSFTVTLTVVDSFGCVEISTSTVVVRQPFASFSISDTFICNNQSINIANLSLGDNLTYDWQFPNATPASDNTATPPIITYNSEGIQTITLQVTDLNLCTDDTSLTVNVFDVVAQASSNVDSIECFSNIVPISFINESFNNVDSSSVFWDLGNGVTTDLYSPSAIYNVAGSYIVSMSISSLTGCRDTSIIDTIFVGGPYANIEVIDRDSACVCETVEFSVTTWNTISPSFFPGDGSIIQFFPNGIIGDTIIDTLQHQYCQLGSFIPQVFIDDGACSGSVLLNDTIQIDSLIVDFSIGNFNFCDTGTICFTDLSANEINGANGLGSWSWDFGDGNTSSLQNPCHSYTTPGSYSVKLVVENDFECIDSISMDLYIPESPNVQIAQSDSNGCIGLEITFYDSTQINPNTSIDTWHWDFGVTTLTDDTANTQNAIYTFNNTGTFWTTLLITDTFGCVGIDSVEVDVFNLPIVDAGADVNVCLWDSIQLTATGANTYVWTPNINITDVNVADPFVFPTGTMDYIVEGTDTNFCVNTDTINVQVDSIFVNFSASISCLNDLTQFNDSSTSSGVLTSWTWDFGEPISGANNTSNIQNPMHTYASASTFNVSLTVQDDNLCSADTIIPVTIEAAPIASFIGDSVCLNTATTFSSVNSSAVGATIDSYFWDFGVATLANDTSILADPTYTYPSAGLFTVTLTITSDQLCPGNSDDTTFVVEVFPAPNVDAGIDANYCEGDSVQVTASGAVTYTWSPDYFISDVNIANPFISSDVDTTYFVTGIGVNSCAYTDTLEITVNTIAIDFSSDTVCLGLISNFTDLSTSSGTINFWSWDFDEPISGANNTSILQNPTHTYATPNTYNVSLSIQDDNSCSADTIIPVLVNTPPFASFTADSVCFGLANTFNSAPSLGGSGNIISYHWDFGDASILTDTSNIANPTFTYSSSGTFTVCLTVFSDLNCINNSDDTCFAIQVFELPTADFTVDTGCLGNQNTFIDNSSSGADGNITTTFWDFDQNLEDTLLVAATPVNTQFTYDNIGLYTAVLTVTDDNFCVSTTFNILEVFDVPSTNFNFVTTCQNQENDVFSIPTGGNGSLDYYWDFDEGAGFIQGDSLETYSFLNTGVHNVGHIVVDVNGCSDTIVNILNINPAPIAVITGDTTVCDNSSTALSGENSIVSALPPVYNWNVSTSQTSNITYLPNGDSFVGLLIVDANGCQDSTSVFIEVLEEPTIDFTWNNACENLPITVTSTATPGDAAITSYAWEINSNTSGNTTFSGPNFTNVWSSMDTLSVELTVTDANGCSEELTQTILVDEQAAISVLTPSFVLCPGSAVTLDLNDTTQFLVSGLGSVSWSPLLGVDDPTGTLVNLNPSLTTTYTVTASSVLNQCPDDDDNEIEIVVAPSPTITLNAIPNPVLVGATSDITAQVVPFNTSTDSLNWDNSSGTLNFDFGFNVEATLAEETTYPVQLYYAFEDTFCTIDTSITITVITECNGELIYVPNIFTPNFDGKNDVFKMSGYGIEAVNYFRIFDRWGQLMYEGLDVGMNNGRMADGWKGDNQGGKACNSGVYVYTYELVCANGDIIKGSGNITLIK